MCKSVVLGLDFQMAALVSKRNCPETVVLKESEEWIVVMPEGRDILSVGVLNYFGRLMITV